MSRVLSIADLRIRAAEDTDYPQVADLLHESQLPLAGVRESFKDFVLLQHQGKIIGVAGLEIYHDKALIRSLAIAEGYRNAGLGKHLCLAIIAKAQQRQMKGLYLLTETAEGFFSRLGFAVADRETVDPGVKTSIEFQGACPVSATCMYLALS